MQSRAPGEVVGLCSTPLRLEGRRKVWAVHSSSSKLYWSIITVAFDIGEFVV